MSNIDASTRRVVITGVGFREEDAPPNPGNVFCTTGIKPNIGAVVALEAARAGYALVIVSKTASKLERVCSSILELVPTADVVTKSIDLLDLDAMRLLAESLPQDREIDLVHSAGLSAGGHKIPDDNPYLDIEKTPAALPVLEFESVVKSLLLTVQTFLPRWRLQQQTRVVIVSSMSGTRAYPFGFSHCAAKGGLHLAVRSLSLELNPLGIRVCEVLPGIVNTGMYDPEPVDTAVRRIAQSFGYSFLPGSLPQMDPLAVAEAVIMCLTSHAHILSVSMVASGQFPQHAS